MGEVPLYRYAWERGTTPRAVRVIYEDRVLNGPASGKKGSKGRNYLDRIRGKGVRADCSRVNRIVMLETDLTRRVSLKWRCGRIDLEQVLQEYLAHKKQRPPSPWDPAVGLCLRPYGGPDS